MGLLALCSGSSKIAIVGGLEIDKCRGSGKKCQKDMLG